jgi:hypothetical protein
MRGRRRCARIAEHHHSRDEMLERCFLATFRPFTYTAGGRRAVQEYGLPSFIDGTCRREPDVESSFPSVLAACRMCCGLELAA